MAENKQNPENQFVKEVKPILIVKICAGEDLFTSHDLALSSYVAISLHSYQ